MLDFTIWSEYARGTAADSSYLEEQRERYRALVARFTDLYGSAPEYVVRSPGACQLSCSGCKMILSEHDRSRKALSYKAFSAPVVTSADMRCAPAGQAA